MTNYFYSTHCKTIISLVLILDCMSFLITIVKVLNFLQNFICTLSAMDNCKIFKILAIAKFWQLLSRIDKLNALVTRKTEYFSFSKHSFRLKVKMAVEPVIGHCSVCGIFSHLILIITGDAIGVVVTNYGEYIVTN